MTGNKIRDYENKCGSCMYFAFMYRNGDTRSDGRCEKKTVLTIIKQVRRLVSCTSQKARMRNDK